MYVSHELDPFKDFVCLPIGKNRSGARFLNHQPYGNKISSESLTLSSCRIVFKAYAEKPFFTS